MNDRQPIEISRKQWILICIILLSAFTGIVGGVFLRRSGLDSTALLYIGVPTLLALVFARTKTATSTVGATVKAITFVILISGPLMQEGYICMLMAAPILYLIGALVALPFDHYRKKRERNESASKLGVYLIPSLVMLASMEGVFEETSFNRHHTAENTQIIQAGINEIKSRLGTDRSLRSPTSFPVRLFPVPDTLKAIGLAVGDQHSTEVTYAKWVFWNETHGSIDFKVAEHSEQHIKFTPTFDDSYLSSYLSWTGSEIIFQPLSKNQTRITWRISYYRKLDPAWYMQPLQSYMAGVAAKVLVDSLR